MSTMDKDSEYKRLPTPARVEEFGFGECVSLTTDEESVKVFLERCGCLGGYFRGMREWFCVGVSDGVGVFYCGV